MTDSEKICFGYVCEMDLEFNVLVKFPGNQPHLLLHSFIPSYQPRGERGREEEEGREGRGGGGEGGRRGRRRRGEEREGKREEVMIVISAAILFQFATRVKDITNS